MPGKKVAAKKAASKVKVKDLAPKKDAHGGRRMLRERVARMK